LRVPLEATPKPAAMPAGKAVRAGVRTPEASDETLSRLLRMRSRLRNLEVDTRWLNREEITQHFTATMGRGHLVGHGYINWSRPEERQWASVEIIGADVEEFLHVADVRFDGKIRAQVSGQLDLEWNGMRFRQMRASMRGKGRLELSKGNVTATRLLDNIARFSGIDELRTLEFDHGGLQGTIKDGRVEVEEFRLEGRDFRLRGKGTVTLETGALDARFEIAVKPALAKRSRVAQVRAAGEALAKLFGGENQFVNVPLPVSFGGTLERPIPYLEVPAQGALRVGWQILEGALTTSPRERRSHSR
jgi:uncharacterized protein YhdP